MNREPDPRADEFDDAIERRRSGDTSSAGDEELENLLNLATRLEHDLSDDLPDPAFRENLKLQLLQGEAEAPFLEPAPIPPVDLADERWHRRLLASPWRVSAAAAACLVVVLVGFTTTGMPGGPADGNDEETMSFQAVDSDDELPVDQSPLSLENATIPESAQWFTSSFPPFDVEHVVLPPLLIGFLPFSERERPQVELTGFSGIFNDGMMPDTSSVYYLNAPPDGGSLLNAVSSTLEIEGELVEGNGDGEPYRIVGPDDTDIMRWDPASAFFHFQVDSTEFSVGDLLDEGTGPSAIAIRFLEIIGFDLHTIDYEHRVVEGDGITEVQFRPHEFPDTGLDVDLGGSVFVNQDGAVVEARLYWLSLIDQEIVSLRDSEEIRHDFENEIGYAPPAPDDTDEMTIEAEDMMFVHVLTRLGESHFVLQPAVKVMGEYGDEYESALPGPARFLVPAAQGGG